jgi:hypothetical protein
MCCPRLLITGGNGFDPTILGFALSVEPIMNLKSVLTLKAIDIAMTMVPSSPTGPSDLPP